MRNPEQLVDDKPIRDSDPLIRLEGVSKVYDDDSATAPIKNLSLIVNSGEFVSIIGESGVGKSTLLNLIGGLTRPDSGEIYYDGKPLSTFGEKALDQLRREFIGFIFQESFAIQALTVRENLIFSTRKRNESVSLGDIDEMLTKLGLTERSDHLPSELSVGQRRRLAIARCLLVKPRVVLADEPTNDLDAAWCDIIIDMLAEVAQSPGRAVVMVTHDSRYIQRTTLCYRLVEGGLVSC